MRTRSFQRFDVELVFFAVFEGGELGGFALLQLRFGGGGARVGIGEFFGELGELRSYFVQPDIHALQFEQLLKDGEHRGILAHGSGAYFMG